MERPYKFSIRNKKTGEWTYQNHEPALHEMQTWEPTENPKVSRLEQTRQCYIDTRYPAKLRLFKYWQKLNGCEDKPYRPFEGTEIGRSKPVLNF